ncbi:MAG: glycosyltransferase family 4 protein [Lachnospiraceae bacterium]|nr:glycosyltransferase family 4 protein [Lachnospiraceae bacterium]
MRIFFAGDNRGERRLTETTNRLIANLPKDTLYLRTSNKVTVAIEILIKTRMADIVVYTGCSRLKLYGMRLAGKLEKKSIYLMEGCLEYENALNGTSDSKTNSIERHMMIEADGIVAVSNRFGRWLSNNYPMHRNKIYCVPYGIDAAACKEEIGFRLNDEGDIDESRSGIVAFGGGVPAHKVKYVAKAIELINSRRASDEPALKLEVVGASGGDSNILDNYPFVENKGDLSIVESYELMNRTKLFVMNSCFESFGVQALEAAICGCSLLTSVNVSSRELLAKPSADDTIENYDDPEEIAEKISYLLAHPNNERVVEGLFDEKLGWEARTEEFRQLIEAIPRQTR